MNGKPAEIAAGCPDRSVHRRRQALDDGEPEPAALDPPPRVRHAGEGAEQRPEVVRGNAGARVLDHDLDLAGAPGGARRGDADRAARRGMARRVLEQVGEDLVEQDRVGNGDEPLRHVGRPPIDRPGSRQADRACFRRPCRSTPARAPAATAPPSMRLRSSRFVTSPLRRAASSSIARPRRARSAGVHLELRLCKGAGRGPNRRQRRPQVVRDRCEERGLRLIAASRDVGRCRCTGKAPALDRLRDLVGGCAKEPRHFGRRQARPARGVPPRATRAPRRRPRGGRDMARRRGSLQRVPQAAAECGASSPSARRRRAEAAQSRRRPAAAGQLRCRRWAARGPRRSPR